MSGGKAKLVNVAELPRPELCLRSRAEGVVVAVGPVQAQDGKLINEFDDISSHYQDLNKIQTEAKCFQYSSENGDILAILSQSSVCVFDNVKRELKLKIPKPDVKALAVSPLGSFVVTWSKHEKDATEGNLIVWRVADGEKVFQAHERNYSEASWPAVKWTVNEELSGHMVKNAVHLYNGQAMQDGIIRKVPFERISGFSLSTTPGPACNDFPFRIATFKGEVKGKPAQAAIFNHPGSDLPVRTKSFFRAETASLLWSPLGNGLLVKTETSVDATGSSYYGETQVYLLRADTDYDCKVVVKKEGTFQDVAWSPKGREFVVIAGKMPAMVVLFNLKGDAVFQFGEAHRNTILWSPHGRFLCLGGFGNLSGDMDFWDINKKSIMGSNKANCAVDYGWSPDGRHFMTASLSPRMKVDNGITIYTYYGNKVFEKKFTELFAAKWRPSLPNVYPDRPQSPSLQERKKSEIKTAKSETKKFVAYRPPGATSSRVADMMRAERAGSGPKKMETTGPVVSKAAKRRERKKLAEAAKIAESPPSGPSPGSDVSKQESDSKYSDKEKTLRKLRKQLKQIVEIEKKKHAGEELNRQQHEKLSKKGEVENQIAELSS